MQNISVHNYLFCLIRFPSRILALPRKLVWGPMVIKIQEKVQSNNVPT